MDQDQAFLKLNTGYEDPDNKGFYSVFWQRVCNDLFDGVDPKVEIYLSTYVLPSHREYYRDRVEEQKSKVKALLD